VSSGKQARASSLSAAYLLLSVGAIASGGREGFGGSGGKRDFGVHGGVRSGQIYRLPAPAGNVGGRTGTAGGKHWSARPLEFFDGNSGARQNFASGAVPPLSGLACRRGGQ
jgi:hypothetical protein